jgi:hypothetical protein
VSFLASAIYFDIDCNYNYLLLLIGWIYEYTLFSGTNVQKYFLNNKIPGRQFPGLPLRNKTIVLQHLATSALNSLTSKFILRSRIPYDEICLLHIIWQDKTPVWSFQTALKGFQRLLEIIHVTLNDNSAETRTIYSRIKIKIQRICVGNNSVCFN